MLFLQAVGDVISERRVNMVVRAIKGEDPATEEVTEEKEEKEEKKEEEVEEMEMFIEIEGDDNEYSSVSTARDTYDQTMIFVNTADAAARLAIEIEKKGVRVAEYHKFISDIEKQESLRRFRDEEVSVLVCTDHASRGYVTTFLFSKFSIFTFHPYFHPYFAFLQLCIAIFHN